MRADCPTAAAACFSGMERGRAGSASRAIPVAMAPEVTSTVSRPSRGLEDEMVDVLFVALLVVLFAVTAGVVKVCDRLVGVDEEVIAVAVVDDDDETQRSAA